MFRLAVLAIVMLCFAAPAQALWAGMPACAKDAKVCPDGSSVGRGGSNCEFAPCPGETTPPGQADTVPGQVPAGDMEPGVVEGNPGPGGADGSEGHIGEASPVPHPDEPVPAPQPLPEGGQRMCTMDAKICPDGTGVGRTGPNCEFAPCPGEVTK